MSEAMTPRWVTEVTAPAAEPLSLAEAKLYLRVDGAEEDALISSMIEAVRHAAEQYLRRSLMTRQWKLVYDDAAPEEVALPMGAAIQIVRVTKVAEGGGTENVASSLYRLSADRRRVRFDQSISAYQVEIVYEAGYANAAAIPAPLRQGMLAHLVALYDGRAEAGALPESAVALYAPYREMSL